MGNAAANPVVSWYVLYLARPQCQIDGFQQITILLKSDTTLGSEHPSCRRDTIYTSPVGGIHYECVLLCHMAELRRWFGLTLLIRFA